MRLMVIGNSWGSGDRDEAEWAERHYPDRYILSAELLDEGRVRLLTVPRWGEWALIYDWPVCRAFYVPVQDLPASVLRRMTPPGPCPGPSLDLG